MTICRGIGFVIQRNFDDGERTKALVIAHMGNWKLFRRKSWQKSSRKVDEFGAISFSSLLLFSYSIPAIHESDHHRGPAFPAKAVELLEHDAG